MIPELKPYLAMRESGVDWLGEVPAHWEVRRLKDTVLGCVNGVWGRDPNGLDDLPCVRVADFDRGRLRVKDSIPTLRAISQSERQKRTLSSGDLLLEKSGGGEQQPVGVVVLFDHEALAVCSNFVARMPVTEGHSPHFLSYLHSTLYAKGLNRRSIKQTIGIQNLDSSAYLSEFAGLPPLPEQTTIVRYLDYVDRRVRRLTRAKRKLIALLTEQKQAIIHRAVTRGLDPGVPLKDSGVEWLGEVPEHWEVAPLKFLSRRIQNGATPSTSEERYYQNGTVPWFGPSSIGGSTELGAPVRYLAKPAFDDGSARLIEGPAVLVVVIGATAGKMGLLLREGATNQQITAFELKANKVEPLFAVEQLRSCEPWLKSTASTATIPILDSGVVNRLPLAFPDTSEQERILSAIADETRALNTTISRAEREIELLNEYRTGLIADVVTGKLDVREVAAALPEVDPLAEADDADDLDADLALDADELQETPEAEA